MEWTIPFCLLFHHANTTKDIMDQNNNYDLLTTITQKMFMTCITITTKKMIDEKG